MNQYLIIHIDAKLESMASYVSRNMPIGLTTDNAYEAMLSCSDDGPAMIAAFQATVQYLSAQSTRQRFNFTLPDGRFVTIQARFNPTRKWPVFICPGISLKIDPESNFAELLDTPIHVATEWESLKYVWEQLRQWTDVVMLVYLMPWIRECLADFDIQAQMAVITPKERRELFKELATIMREDTDVLFYPRMSKALSAVARSGKTLIAQYRMLESSHDHDTLERSPLTVEHTPSLLEPWLIEHMAEALSEWVHDKAMHEARTMMKNIAKRGLP